MDKKGIATYLGITLLLSYAAQMLVFYVPGTSAVYVSLLAIPALAAWVGGRIIPRPEFAAGTLWPIPIVRALRIACAIYLGFVIVFLITTAVGFTHPDWRIGSLLSKISAYPELQAAVHSKAMLPTLFLLFAGGVVFVVAPTAYAVLMLGVTYGWFGYLLPRLMPLGRWAAYGILGVAAGISVMPAVVFSNPGHAVAHACQMLAFAVAAAAMIGEIWRRSGNLALAAVAGGCLYGHIFTFWEYLFPLNATVFPWGGTIGLFVTLAWILVALAPDEVFGPLEPSHSAESPRADS